jgi:hypothetical protein
MATLGSGELGYLNHEKLWFVSVPRDATERYLEQAGRALDIVFDVDLGELVKGHHVIVRGVDLGHDISITRSQQEFRQRAEQGAELILDRGEENRLGGFQSFVRINPSPEDREIVETVRSEPELHYEFIPGLEPDESPNDHFFWYWMLTTSDDVGTEYQDHNNGTLARHEGGVATHGTRDLGGRIPDSATRLSFTFEPPSGWTPTNPIRQGLAIDLVTLRLLD